jgi:hypothetical protein
MRRLKVPSLGQWGCPHRWKTTHSLPQQDALHRVRYHKCLRCGLRAKTEERPAVPWDDADLVAEVKTRLPEGQVVALHDQGITELPLAWLNARLAAHGYVIHARKGWDRTRRVGCMDEAGRVALYGLFELRPMKASGRVPGKRRRGK